MARGSASDWLRREFGESWGIRNLEGVGEPDDPENRFRVMRLAGTVGAALAATAVLASIVNVIFGADVNQYKLGNLLALAVGGALLAIAVYRFATSLPLWFVHVGVVTVNVALFGAAWFAGEAFVFALMAYVAVGTVLAMIVRIGPLAAHLTLVAVANAVILLKYSRSQQGSAVSGFIVIVGVMLVAAGSSAWLVTRLRDLARSEIAARQDTEAARAEVEVVSKHKSAFLANMSHELRTPLNAIIGFSDLLDQELAGGLTDKQREYVVDIRSSGHHLLSLINDVLDLAKVEAGKYDVKPTRFALGDALMEGVRIVRDRAEESGVHVTVAVDPNVGVIEADERKVRQIVLNLLSNAVKFTPRGGRVWVEASVDGPTATVSVRDTGVGIPKAEQDGIFDEFTRADGVTAEGTGLGLALAKRFVELHGGRIWVESVPGHGSTFRFTLPTAPSAPAVVPSR